MNFLYKKENDILKKDINNIFKKKTCWADGCSNTAIHLTLDRKFYDWLISEKNKYPYLVDLCNEIVLELLTKNHNDIWWFYCLDHEIGWAENLVPKINKNWSREKIGNIFNKWQEKFFKVNVSYVFFLKIHFFISKYKNESFEIEKYFTDDEWNLNDSEKIWLKDPAYFLSIPINIKVNYHVAKYNGAGTSNQGQFNGPDFIFKNKKTNQTTGIEIVEYQPLVFNFAKTRNIEKFILGLDRTISNKMHIDADKKMDKINEIIASKIKKAKSYERTDQLCLALIMNHKIKGFEYYFFELWTTLNWKSGLNESPFKDIYFI